MEVSKTKMDSIVGWFIQKKMCEMISSQDCLNTAMLNDTNDIGNCYF